MPEYTQGVCDDGAAILEDGRRLTIEEILERLRKAADNVDSVATVLPPDPYDERDGLWLSNADMRALKALPSGTKLYTQPPAPQVPYRAGFDLLMRDICERDPVDPDSERALCINYDWLYDRIKEAMLPTAPQPGEA